jgi:hypothetical protein
MKVVLKDSQVAQFWSKVEQTNGCWAWHGRRNIGGYGIVNVYGTEMGAHRVSWIIHHGDIPAGIFVCHHCDNPPCTRPDHLFLGTHWDNTLDMIRKGRHGFSHTNRRRGSQNGSSKLTEEQVREIRSRASAESQRSLAREFGVSNATVSLVVRRRIWTHL